MNCSVNFFPRIIPKVLRNFRKILFWNLRILRILNKWFQRATRRFRTWAFENICRVIFEKFFESFSGLWQRLCIYLKNLMILKNFKNKNFFASTSTANLLQDWKLLISQTFDFQKKQIFLSFWNENWQLKRIIGSGIILFAKCWWNRKFILVQLPNFQIWITFNYSVS